MIDINQRFDTSIYSVFITKGLQVGLDDAHVCTSCEREEGPSPTNGLLTPNPTNSYHLTRDVAYKIYQVAQAARDVRVQAIRPGKGLERKSYIKDNIIEAGSKFELSQTPTLLDTLFNTLEYPHDAYPSQVEKAFLLAIRNLYRSIDACRAIARPLSQHPK